MYVLRMASWGIALYWFCSVFDSPEGVLYYMFCIDSMPRNLRFDSPVGVLRVIGFELLQCHKFRVRFARRGTVLYCFVLLRCLRIRTSIRQLGYSYVSFAWIPRNPRFDSPAWLFICFVCLDSEESALRFASWGIHMFRLL